jgi:hypothetical protein
MLIGALTVALARSSRPRTWTFSIRHPRWSTQALDSSSVMSQRRNSARTGRRCDFPFELMMPAAGGVAHEDASISATSASFRGP